MGYVWGWPQALSQRPSLRALIVTRPGSRPAEWEYDLLEAAGIERQRVSFVDHPVRVERLLGSTPMYDIGHFIHPEMSAIYDAIGGRLAEQAISAPEGVRVFHSRRGRRACRNTTEVENVFRESGFDIVYPEEEPLARQVARVRSAGVVAGFAGSNLFHIAFAGKPLHLHNEYMMSALLGHALDVVVCRPDIPRADGFDRRAFQSDYWLDMDREGRFLRDVLADLPE
jgi:hypothetical protein